MVVDSESRELAAYLRDWLAHASGFFIDRSVRCAEDLRGAPLGAPIRRMALPAGIERRGFDGQECFIILEFCVTGASRVSFWERAGPGEWDFIRDTSVAD
jgi:hypothetical protein